jgi:hypothetical protein
MGLKLLHERGNIRDHWSGTLLETSVLTFTDFQSISVEAATCLLVTVHWIQSYASLRTPRVTGQKPASQPAEHTNLSARPFSHWDTQPVYHSAESQWKWACFPNFQKWRSLFCLLNVALLIINNIILPVNVGAIFITKTTHSMPLNINSWP